MSKTSASDACIALEIASGFDMLSLVDHVSEDVAALAGLESDAGHWFCVAVREATVNAIKHGNQGNQAKRVTITFTVVRNGGAPRVDVCVRDQGRGFDATRVPDPLAAENTHATGGRGIFLMRSFMDDVRVRSAPGGGTEILMRKSLAPTTAT
jgi:serine/threonine-protein kinase RsbW